MACMVKKGTIYSPESTVSSLLASGSLHSSSSSLNSHSSIQYKDRFYRSASQALEAYIEDFDRSLISPDIRPGKIQITQSTPKDFRSSKNSVKHKYALENLKQHATLGSVAPHLRRKTAYELDMLSLTTDDLLAFPADGSASFTRSSALKPVVSDSSNENSTLPHIEESGSTSVQDSKKLIWSQIQDRPNISGVNNALDMECRHDVKENCQYDTPSVCFTPRALKKHIPLFKDDDVDLLLQKTRKTVEASAEELTSVLQNDGSPCTVDVLEGERSWDNGPVGLKSPVPVHCEENSLQSPKASIVNGFLEDCLKNGSQESTFSGGNHHGPVEALKLMLFNLQAVQHSFNQNKTDGQNEEFKKTSYDDVEFKLCDHDTIPVTQSLQRALHHLSRLKGLVEDTGYKEESKEPTKT